jgi:hypothetical protein
MDCRPSRLSCVLLFTAIVSGGPIIGVSGSGSYTVTKGVATESFSFSGTNGVDTVSFTTLAPFFVGPVPPPIGANGSVDPGLLTIDGVSSTYYGLYLPQGGSGGFVNLYDSSYNLLVTQAIYGDIVVSDPVFSADFTSATYSFVILPVDIPEPAAWSLSLVGMSAFLIVKRRNRLRRSANRN